MKTKSLIGKIFQPEKIPENLREYLPNDYDSPCWRITIPEYEYEAVERCYFYADIIVDDNNVIKKIERNKDNYLTNYLINRFPLALEESFAEMMGESTVN